MGSKHFLHLGKMIYTKVFPQQKSLHLLGLVKLSGHDESMLSAEQTCKDEVYFC